MRRTRSKIDHAGKKRLVSLLPLVVCLGLAPAAFAAAPTRGVADAPYHSKLMTAYDLVASTPFAYSNNEIDAYGERAMSLSGEARVYALWRVLYAYKSDDNDAKMEAWHNRIARLAQDVGDSNLDLLARFMFQAFQNERSGFTDLSDREWSAYLSVSSPALQNIVLLERERQYQYFRQWADAIDMGDSLIVRLQAAGEPAQGLLDAAQQTMAYNMLMVGDYDSYADHMLAVARLPGGSAFFVQKVDMLYDLAFFANQDNDVALAQRFQKLYTHYVHTYNLVDLKPWDEELCASVADKGSNYRAVIDCLKDTAGIEGKGAGAHDAFRLKLLVKAYARLGDVAHAQQYLTELHEIPESVFPRDPLFEAYVDAYMKAGEGRSGEAVAGLGNLILDMNRSAETSRVAAVQDMYKALRKELDSKSAEARLLNHQVELGRLLFAAAAVIVVLLSLMIVGGALWVIRMRRMQWRLKDAHEHAEAANAAKSRFLAVMSHELRTPLNGVLGMAQALKKDELSETQAGQVDILVESGETLMMLLNDVLDMSRIEAGKIELAPTQASMKDMLERVINTYTPTIEDKPLVLRYDLDDNVPASLAFDVLRVYQCLSNLVSNAVKFTERGTIRIIASAERIDGKTGYLVRVEIRDTGIGMSRTVMDKLFEAYAQAEAGTARKYGGTGLGLSISRRLAELMGGTLSVTSEEGVGSSFIMTFQAGEVVQSAPRVVAEVAEDAQTPTASIGRRILLVDDHPVNRKVARLFLEPFGFEITEAADGQEALDAGMEGFDLVLMDLNMPKVGGIEATRLFRSTEAPGRHVPIVALTADAMPEQIDACLAVGMDAHISKPILMDQLIETVNTLLNASQDEDAAATA